MTGRCDWWVISAVATNGHGSCLPPNEPPVGGMITRTRSCGSVKARGDVPLLVERLVVAADHGQPAVLIVVAQQRLPLQRGVLEEREAVLGLDDDVRPGERGVQVAVLHLEAGSARCRRRR